MSTSYIPFLVPTLVPKTGGGGKLTREVRHVQYLGHSAGPTT